MKWIVQEIKDTVQRVSCLLAFVGLLGAQAVLCSVPVRAERGDCRK
jgi:hypothetical protein